MLDTTEEKAEFTNVETRSDLTESNDPDSWMFEGMSEAVDEKTAQKDIISWLNSKNFSLRKRKNLQEYIKMLAAAVQDGDLRVQDGVLVQVIRGDHNFGELKYSQRMTIKDFTDATKRWKSKDDGSGGINATVALTTGITYAQACQIDGEDRELMSGISLFFM